MPICCPHALQILAQPAAFGQDDSSSMAQFYDTACHALTSVLHSAKDQPSHLAALQQQFLDAGALEPLLAELSKLSQSCAAAASAPSEHQSWSHRHLAISLLRALSELGSQAVSRALLERRAGEHMGQVLALVKQWLVEDCDVAVYGLRLAAHIVKVGSAMPEGPEGPAAV